MYLLWLRVATVLYGIASITTCAAVLGHRPRLQRISLPIAIIAWFFHLVSTVEMLTLAHHLMPIGMREVQSVLALDRKSTRLNSSHRSLSRMPSSA